MSDIQAVTLHNPPNYPPYESQIDMRIPAHFTSKDLIRPYVNVDDPIYVTSEKISKEAKLLFNAAGVRGFIRLSRAKYLDPVTEQKQDSPYFFAVTMARGNVAKWSYILPSLRELIIHHYAQWEEPIYQDPAIRVFQDIAVIDF
ncbi:hypothetical protein LTR56_003276 [Elasticomyces elasticus]|nr:hypothetical protein LTR22_011840 [Elasticomyces elasticus]KAK3656144.1 hypothetical protein LTR56_003276 [Elasticomyces elasticus]KAK4912429.1 hypothetical protein LTR49_019146 [Elasticomyces elasticus]KAK5751670.1 hypothetical protein LTS12_018282 [Elasticomyces elasticus]